MSSSFLDSLFIISCDHFFNILLVLILFYLKIRRRGRSKRSAVEVFLEAIKGKENYEKEDTEAEIGRVVRMSLRLSPKQTRHRRRGVKIQPATTYLQHDIDYKVRCIS